MIKRTGLVARVILVFFFFNDTATTEIYTLSLHDALPIWRPARRARHHAPAARRRGARHRSEEHTSELQSRSDLVCRLLLEKKNKTQRVQGRSQIAYIGLVRPPANKP